MFHRLTALALSTTVALAPATGMLQASALPAPDDIGIRPVDLPIATRTDPRARSHIVDHVNPGMAIHRRVEVSNKTDAPVRVAIYPAAASIDGGSFASADGRTSNELSAWTSTVPRRLFLAPHSSSTATVTVTVPDDASAGERYAMVWAGVTTTAPTGGVSEVNRAGIRLYSLGRPRRRAADGLHHRHADDPADGRRRADGPRPGAQHRGPRHRPDR